MASTAGYTASADPRHQDRPGRKESRVHIEGRPALHNLRRSLSNWLVNKSKIEPKTVQGILRHSKNQTTLDPHTQEDSDDSSWGHPAREGVTYAALFPRGTTSLGVSRSDDLGEHHG